MLTLQKCRELLGRNCPLSDPELESLRDQIYGLADIAVTSLLQKIYLLIFSPFDFVAVNESVTVTIIAGSYVNP